MATTMADAASRLPRAPHPRFALLGSSIVLVDSEQLSQLMIDHNLGVALVTCYETKKIDSDYFIEG